MLQPHPSFSTSYFTTLLFHSVLPFSLLNTNIQCFYKLVSPPTNYLYNHHATHTFHYYHSISKLPSSLQSLTLQFTMFKKTLIITVPSVPLCLYTLYFNNSYTIFYSRFKLPSNQYTLILFEWMLWTDRVPAAPHTGVLLQW